MEYKTKWKKESIVDCLIVLLAQHVMIKLKIKMKRILTVEDLVVTPVQQKRHAPMESKIRTKMISTVEEPVMPVKKVNTNIFFIPVY